MALSNFMLRSETRVMLIKSTKQLGLTKNLFTPGLIWISEWVPL